jgi:hypothetical protein
MGCEESHIHAADTAQSKLTSLLGVVQLALLANSGNTNQIEVGKKTVEGGYRRRPDRVPTLQPPLRVTLG